MVSGSTRRVHRLTHIATNKIIQHVGSISDVGTTPFHLLQPILQRMSAKQLASIEALSPQLLPHTEIVWKELILKDFPDRLITLPLDLLSKETPYRNLYKNYLLDRDKFKQDTVQRLRNMNARINSEKSINKVVVVPGILKEPLSRCRNRMNRSRIGISYGTPKSNSILSKAKRDLQYRPAMFGQRAMKKYDAFAAFDTHGSSNRNQDRPIMPPRRPMFNQRVRVTPVNGPVVRGRSLHQPPRKTTDFNPSPIISKSPLKSAKFEQSPISSTGSETQIKSLDSNLINGSKSPENHTNTQLSSTNESASMAAKTASSAPTSSHAQPSLQSPPPARRKRPPSIFLPNRRQKLASPIKKKEPPAPPIHKPSGAPLKPIKSSIFR